MKSSSAPTTAQVGFWGICLLILLWIGASCLFEGHLGWPVGGIQWMKRSVGWGVELLLVRAFILGVRRHYAVRRSGFQANR